MSATEACGFCGEWFTKKWSNQRYCCEKCKKDAEKLRLKRRYFDTIKSEKKGEKRCAPSISIEGMVDIMLKLEKELGRVVQYGEVQQMLMTGKIKVKDGVML
jgi:hypothetical protein